MAADRRVGMINVAVTATTKAFEAGLKRAQTGLKKFRSGMKRVQKAVFSFRGAMVGLATGAIANSIKKTIEAGNEISKFARRIGISTEALTRLGFAAESTGTDMNAFRVGLQRMTRRTAEAAAGSSELQKVFAELGLDAERINKLEPDQQFLAIQQALRGVRNEGDKVRLTFKLFDTEGVGLKNLLSASREDMARMAADAERLGAVMTTEEGLQLEDAAQAMYEAGVAWDSAMREFAIAAGPLLRDLAKWFQDFVQWQRSVGNWVGGWFGGGGDAGQPSGKYAQYAQPHHSWIPQQSNLGGVNAGGAASLGR